MTQVVRLHEQSTRNDENKLSADLVENNANIALSESTTHDKSNRQIDWHFVGGCVYRCLPLVPVIDLVLMLLT